MRLTIDWLLGKADTAPATVNKNVWLYDHCATRHGKVVKQSGYFIVSLSLISPETGLSLRRQTAGCGLVLIDSLCPSARTPLLIINYLLGCEH